jgi:hypothetical protein
VQVPFVEAWSRSWRLVHGWKGEASVCVCHWKGRQSPLSAFGVRVMTNWGTERNIRAWVTLEKEKKREVLNYVNLIYLRTRTPLVSKCPYDQESPDVQLVPEYLPYLCMACHEIIIDP